MITNSINPKFHTAQTQSPRASSPIAKGQSPLQNITFGNKNPLENLGHVSVDETKKALIKTLSESEKEDLRMVKEVFEPLSEFKGTNAQFAKKAYRALLKFRKLDDAPPRFKIENTKNDDSVAAFYFLSGKFTINKANLNKCTHGDIIEAIDHELDHYKRFGDLACVLGVDNFARTTEKRLNSHFRKEATTDKSLMSAINSAVVDNHKRLDGLKPLEKEAIIEELQKVEDPEDTEFNQKLIKTVYPEGLENLSKQGITERFSDFDKKGKKALVNYFIDLNGMKVTLDRAFWNKYTALKKPSVPKNTDITPYYEALGAINGKNIPKSNYKNLKEYQIYLSNPFEVAAWEKARHTKALWVDFTKKKGIEEKEEFSVDERETIKYFSVIDKVLSDNFKNQKTKAGVFDVLFMDTKNELVQKGQNPDDKGVLLEILKGWRKPVDNK